MLPFPSYLSPSIRKYSPAVMVVVVKKGFAGPARPPLSSPSSSAKSLTLMLFKNLFPLVAVVTGFPLIVIEVLSVVATRRTFSVSVFPSPFLKIYLVPTLL